MKEKLIVVLMLCFSSALFGQKTNKDTWRLYYLGGQSNMDGYGYNSQLPDSLNKTFDKVYIFHGNPVGDNEINGGKGIWKKLQPGHGVGFSADSVSNTYSDRFGVELSFASKLQQLYPNSKIAIIKYSRGGTSLDSLASYGGSWDPDFSGINQYDHFLSTLKNASKTKDINNDGIEDVLIPEGIIWMQGESDAAFIDERVAKKYFFHLDRMMKLQRASFQNNKLPIVIGKISDSYSDNNGKVWDYLELVQYAQEQFANKDKNTLIVRSTKNYEYSDPWHYDSDGFIDLGQQFANAIKKLSDAK
jgi:hypothetical protein